MNSGTPTSKCRFPQQSLVGAFAFCLVLVSGGLLPPGASAGDAPAPQVDWIPPAPWIHGNGSPDGNATKANAELNGDWSVDPRGGFGYSMALEVPEGRAGMQPALTLRYDDAENGPLGVGWTLSGALSAITRCGKSLATEGYVGGVNFSVPDSATGSDRFCLDGQKLVAVNGKYGRRPPALSSGRI